MYWPVLSHTPLGTQPPSSPSGSAATLKIVFSLDKEKLIAPALGAIERPHDHPENQLPIT